MKRIFTILLSALVSIALLAQAPNMMDFQSLVRDASGNFVSNKTIGVQISILKTSATGTVVYRETHSVTTNANGLLTLTIGKGTVKAGTFASIDWSAGPYFLKTEMDVNGGTSYTLTQTTQMMSVPYALYANKAGNVAALEARIAALETKNANGGTNVGTVVKASDGTIPAAFSVSATKKVYFSKGNLQYQPSTKTLRFATNQYDRYNEDPDRVNKASSTSWIDLFAWGAGNNLLATNGASTFVDWGTNAISNGGNVANKWYTLTDTEFNYLNNTRANASKLKLNTTVCGVGGTVFLPDNFFSEAQGSYVMVWQYQAVSNITADMWKIYESFGAVFLPNVNFWSYYNSNEYWSHTTSDTGFYYWWHNASIPTYARGDKRRMYSVRLVRNAQ